MEEHTCTLCVECGPGVTVDEDGTCVVCGATAVGAWLEGSNQPDRYQQMKRKAAAFDQLAQLTNQSDPEAVVAEVRRAQKRAEDGMEFHRVMKALRRSRMEHGTCEPRSRKACTACAGREELDAMLAEYRGGPVVLADAAKGGG